METLPGPLSGSGITDDPRIERVLFDEATIRRRVRELARRIAADYRDCPELLVVGILNGAFVFTADLAREIRRAGGPPARYEFVRMQVYGDAVHADGRESDVRLLTALPDVRGRDVLVVEDILDRGHTLSYFLPLLQEECGAESVRLCVLLRKEIEAPPPEVAQRRSAVKADYVGFDIPDRWVAGYGLDAGGCFRDLPAVVIVREEYFT